MIKEKYDIKHVICLCHNIHNLTETIKEQMPHIQKFLKKISEKWGKAPNFVKQWKETPNLPSYPTYVMTRWGTWLKTAIFYKIIFHQFVIF